MQLLYPKPEMLHTPRLMNNHMLSIQNHQPQIQQQMFMKYGQMLNPYGLPISPPNGMNYLSMDVRPRRRRNNYSLVATMDPVAVARRNERERNRVKQVNDGFDALRKKVPFLPDKKKLSKVEILRCAMMYMQDLKGVVEEFDCNNLKKRKDSESSMSEGEATSSSEEESIERTD